MPYDVKAKHEEIVTLLSEQYQVYEKARCAFLSSQRDREYKARMDRRDEGIELAIKSLRDDIAWEASNEDKAKMDESGTKLYLAVKYVVKHYSYWHAGRIRAASGIPSHDWLMLMTPLCLPDYLSESLHGRQHDEWTQAIDLADSFIGKEAIKGMSGRKYIHELFKRANNLLDMRQAQAVR